mmetsp:Transcript_7705/g.21025  ORF Transcript_7705/g.21025 Transcript_7705/m.21025 type:complete len:247 (-) Transcript_7705:959-1699(-)
MPRVRSAFKLPINCCASPTVGTTVSPVGEQTSWGSGLLVPGISFSTGSLATGAAGASGESSSSAANLALRVGRAACTICDGSASTLAPLVCLSVTVGRTLGAFSGFGGFVNRGDQEGLGDDGAGLLCRAHESRNPVECGGEGDAQVVALTEAGDDGDDGGEMVPSGFGVSMPSRSQFHGTSSLFTPCTAGTISGSMGSPESSTSSMQSGSSCFRASSSRWSCCSYASAEMMSISTSVPAASVTVIL